MKLLVLAYRQALNLAWYRAGRHPVGTGQPSPSRMAGVHPFRSQFVLGVLRFFHTFSTIRFEAL
jgi:hypothetical protein